MCKGGLYKTPLYGYGCRIRGEYVLPTFNTIDVNFGQRN